MEISNAERRTFDPRAACAAIGSPTLSSFHRREGWGVLRLIGDFGFDEFAEEDQRFLPAEVAGFGGDHGGDPFLGDADFGAAKNLPQGDGGLHFAGKIGVVEFIAVADEFVGFEF